MKRFFVFLLLCLSLSCYGQGSTSPKAVDLGLSVQWASCNLGAEDTRYAYYMMGPKEYRSYGDLYAWAVTKPAMDLNLWLINSTSRGDEKWKDINTYYSWSKYKWCNSDRKITKYYGNNTSMERADDAATMTLGGQWRMPTAKEFEELINNCTWEYISDIVSTEDGRDAWVQGYQITSKVNGNSIFLPTVPYVSSRNGCCYWTSTLDEREPTLAKCFQFDDKKITEMERFHGAPIRPVTDAKTQEHNKPAPNTFDKEDSNVINVDTMPDGPPKFQGGAPNLFPSWVAEHLVYPPNAKKDKIQGTVYTQFTIYQDGTIQDVKVTQGVNPELDAEAIRVIKSSPRWTPAKQNGRLVKYNLRLPVVFQLGNDAETLMEQMEGSRINISPSEKSSIGWTLLSYGDPIGGTQFSHNSIGFHSLEESYPYGFAFLSEENTKVFFFFKREYYELTGDLIVCDAAEFSVKDGMMYCEKTFDYEVSGDKIWLGEEYLNEFHKHSEDSYFEPKNSSEGVYWVYNGIKYHPRMYPDDYCKQLYEKSFNRAPDVIILDEVDPTTNPAARANQIQMESIKLIKELNNTIDPNERQRINNRLKQLEREAEKINPLQ